MLASLALMLHALNCDDDRYKDLEDYSKYQYFHFFDVPGLDHVRIPIPFEVGIMWGTFPVAAGEYFSGTKDGDAMLKYLKHSVNDTMRIDWVPQTIKPIVHQFANKDTFTGRPIVPTYLKDVEPEEQYKPWTSKTSREIGKIFGVSPARIDKLIYDYTAYMGTFTMHGIDQFLSIMAEYPDDPAVTVGERYISGLGRFIKGSDVPKSTKAQQDFYELKADVDKAYFTLNHYKRLRQRGAYQAYRKAHRERLSKRKGMSKFQKQISTLNQKIKLVYANTTKLEDQKRTEIDRYLERRNELFKKAIRRFK